MKPPTGTSELAFGGSEPEKGGFVLTESSYIDKPAPESSRQEVVSEPQMEMMTLHIPAQPINDSFAYRFIKRAADIVIASLALCLAAPTMIVVAILIYLEDRGPVIYRQTRVGRFGVPFRFYKLRSMYMNADAHREKLLKHSDAAGVAFKMKNDPRVTKIGRIIRKLSIDESPQLFSVLGGHMSIIGPRPHLQSEVDHYTPAQRQRLMVKPGLLCLREIKGRSNLSWEEWLRLDMEYVQTRNLLLDLKIILLAIPAVLKGEGSY